MQPRNLLLTAVCVLQLAAMVLFGAQAPGRVHGQPGSKLGIPRMWPPDIVIQVPDGAASNDAREIVRRRFVREERALHRCVQQIAGGGDAASGKTLATFTVLPNGAVRDVDVHGQLGPARSLCIARRIEGFHFKPFADKRALVRASWVQD